jgi:hypothetical protein
MTSLQLLQTVEAAPCAEFLTRREICYFDRHERSLPHAIRRNQTRMTMVLDKVLRKPIEAGLIPGVVALAADDRGVILRC